MRADSFIGPLDQRFHLIALSFHISFLTCPLRRPFRSPKPARQWYFPFSPALFLILGTIYRVHLRAGHPALDLGLMSGKQQIQSGVAVRLGLVSAMLAVKAITASLITPDKGADRASLTRIVGGNVH